MLGPIDSTLNLGFATSSSSRSPSPNKDAWKAHVSQKPIPVRFSLLPQGQARWGAMSLSLVLQIVLAGTAVAIPLLFPQQMIPKMVYQVMNVAQPQTDVPLPPKPPVIKPRVQPPPVEQPPPPEPQVAKLMAPPRIVAPQLKPKTVRSVAAPDMSANLTPVKMDDASDQPARPREPVKTGMLSTGSAAVPTINKPVDKVQTGGFGDPNGVPGPGNPNKAANVNRFGSPALPPGPGYGNGTGGANGARGVVASTGFGNGVANPPSGSGHPHGTVQTSGFSDGNAAAAAPTHKTEDTAGAVTPVVILAKPKPIYTDEARKLNIEGEVLLDVVFPASGPVQVNRVIRGLGHGLDENAIRAAEQIQFKPAMSNGHAVDFPATVHIVFEMAY